MPNPYAPRTTRTSQERVSDLEQFVGRIIRLGATADEVASVREAWDELDEDWTAERRAELVRASDEVLVAMIRQSRAEYPYDDDPPLERPELEQNPGAVVLGIMPGEPDQHVPWDLNVPDLSVAKVLAWVNDVDGDYRLARARAALSVEQGRGEGAHGARTTLVGPLEELLSGHAD